MVKLNGCALTIELGHCGGKEDNGDILKIFIFANGFSLCIVIIKARVGSSAQETHTTLTSSTMMVSKYGQWALFATADGLWPSSSIHNTMPIVSRNVYPQTGLSA